jgi:acetyl-CoA C-acetyltransferase
MREVVIANAVRTAIGKLAGTLSSVPAEELGGIVIREVLARAQVRPEKVDEVIMGNVLQAGLGRNPAGQASMRAGINLYVPALTVNKVCGAGMKGVIMATQAIKSGDADIIIAGGMENTSEAPLVLPSGKHKDAEAAAKSSDQPNQEGLWCSIGYADTGVTPEEVGKRFNISREKQDEFAAKSQQKAEAAIASGRFKDEIVPVEIPQAEGKPIIFDTDENPTFGTTVEQLAQLEPIFERGGKITAGNSSGITDGASALLIMSAEKAFKMGIKPLATIVGYDYQWCEPELMGYGPIYAARGAIHKVHDRLDGRIDLVELTETFAAQSIGCLRELNLDPAIVNVNGGAIALGHAMGCSGARILTTLLHEMVKRDAKIGLAAGMGIATIVERKWYY